jgi:Zn-dependent M16 (insulinase) family peptidase
LSSLPKLRREDIERGVEIIPTDAGACAGIPALYHDLFTNGIAYLDLAFDCSHVPDDLHPYLPLLGKLMTNMGAAGLGYEELAKRLALKTGGVACSLSAGMTADGNEAWQKMNIRLKTLYRNIPDGVRLL